MFLIKLSMCVDGISRTSFLCPVSAGMRRLLRNSTVGLCNKATLYNHSSSSVAISPGLYRSQTKTILFSLYRYIKVMNAVRDMKFIRNAARPSSC